MIVNGKNKCYDKIRAGSSPCEEKSCRYFLSSKKHKNCTILASENGPLTLQEIGDIFGVSRMRICQIEKSILKKIKKSNNSFQENDDTLSGQ